MTSTTAGVTTTGEIVAVLSSSMYCLSINCASEVVGEAIVKCGSCGVKMKSWKCKISQMAQVLVEGDDGKEMRVTMFDDMLTKIAAMGSSDDGDLEDKLLTKPCLKFGVQKNTVYAVELAQMYFITCGKHARSNDHQKVLLRGTSEASNQF